MVLRNLNWKLYTADLIVQKTQKIEIPLKQLTEKELNKYLKQLKQNIKNSIVNRG